MASVIQHLATISDRYTVFENDQVLTKEPLNALVDYLDDQERLTRVALLGVGIVCGLRVSLDGASIVVSKGVGVTTDGDLLRVPDNQTFTRFRAYDENAPEYKPFFDGETRRTVFELLGDDVTTAAKLDTFEAVTAKVFTDLVAVLLMESALRDGDVCTGGDCDNKGQQAQGNVRLLLLHKDDVQALHGSIATVDGASRDLTPIHATRALLGPAIDSKESLADAYRRAAATTRAALDARLPAVYRACAPILADLFAADPSSRWVQGIKEPDAVTATSFQPYLGFLKDLVDTCNAIAETVAGETSVCCPPLDAFPKHLVLGGVVGDARDDTNRTGFYPSPLVGASRQTVDRARYLVRRIDTLINTFVGAAALEAVTITPSRGDDRPLDERAIPAYYKVDTGAPWPIHRAWSFDLERRKQAVYNYGANAKAFNAKGAAEAPLTASLAGYPVLRIEGHLGRKVEAVMKEIQGAITKSNLPFAVRAVLLDTDRDKIKIKPLIRYTDLHRFHHLLRHDVSLQLDDVIKQTELFKDDVDRAVDAKVVADTVLSGGVKSVVNTARVAVDTSARLAKDKLALGYTKYKVSGWQDEVKETVRQAADVRVRLGDVARTELVSPVDAMVANKHTLWTEWLDAIIDTRNEQEDDKLLFANFIAQHPAAEHSGVVPRGGTFVLVYDSGHTVVADVTLPYYWPEVAEPEPKQEPLPPPKSRPPVIEKGWRIFPPLVPIDPGPLIAERIRFEFDDFKKREFEPFKAQTADFAKNYVQAVKESTQILGAGKITLPDRAKVPSITDFGLDVAVRDVVSKTDRVDAAHKVLLDPTIDPTKRAAAEDELKAADAELAVAVEKATTIVIAGNVDTRTDGVAAAGVVADALSRLSPDSAKATGVKLNTALERPGVTADVQTLIGGGVLKGRGLR
jgi:hypothetical protein